LNNDLIIGYGIQKLCEVIDVKPFDSSITINILNDSLSKLDPNSQNYVEKLNAITGAIIELKKSENDEKTIKNKIFAIQALFDLNSLYLRNK